MIALGVLVKENFTTDTLSFLGKTRLVKWDIAGGSKDNKTPFDKVWDTVKGCCIGCCKCPQTEEPEEVSEGGTPASKKDKPKNLFQVNRLEKAPKSNSPRDGSENHLSDLIASNDAPSLLLSNNKKNVDVEDPVHTNNEMNEIFKEAQNLNFPKIDENDTKSPTDRLNSWKSTAGPTNSDDKNGYISLYDHQKEALHERSFDKSPIFWMKSSVCPEFFNNNPRVAGLDPIEYKFWLGMVDPKCGYIRLGLHSYLPELIGHVLTHPCKLGPASCRLQLSNNRTVEPLKDILAKLRRKQKRLKLKELK